MWDWAVHGVVVLAMSSIIAVRLRYEDQPLASPLLSHSLLQILLGKVIQW
jgi:hypothetical protein